MREVVAFKGASDCLDKPGVGNGRLFVLAVVDSNSIRAWPHPGVPPAVSSNGEPCTGRPFSAAN